jgi:hypothetical protein
LCVTIASMTSFVNAFCMQGLTKVKGGVTMRHLRG